MLPRMPSLPKELLSVQEDLLNHLSINTLERVNSAIDNEYFSTVKLVNWGRSNQIISIIIILEIVNEFNLSKLLCLTSSFCKHEYSSEMIQSPVKSTHLWLTVIVFHPVWSNLLQSSSFETTRSSPHRGKNTKSGNPGSFIAVQPPLSIQLSKRDETIHNISYMK